MAIDIQDYINRGKRLDPGTWPINAPLVIPPGRRLAGSGAVEPINPGKGGTRLEPTFSVGRPDDPPIITFQGDGLICDLTFGRTAGADIFSPQPWLIYSDGGAVYGVRNRVQNVVFDRIWKGIRASTRDTIRDVSGEVMSVGICLDVDGDIGTIDNCKIEPWYNEADTTVAWLKANTIGFDIIKADGFFVSNSYAFECAIGWRFGMGSQKCYGCLVNSGAEACGWTGVWIEQSNGPGLSFHGCTLGFTPNESQGRAIVTGPNFTGAAYFSGVRHWGGTAAPVLHQGSGYLAISQSSLEGWGDSEYGIRCLQGPVSVVASSFRAGRKHVWCEQGVPCANVVGNTNLDGGSLQVRDDTGGRVVQMGNS